MYLHQTCAKCEKQKNKKCKGYQFNYSLENVKLNCKRFKEEKDEK